MLKYVVRRTMCAGIVLFGATLLTYAMMMLAPGDAALEVAIARYGGRTLVDRDTIHWIRKKEGLDDPLHLQYLHWLQHVVRLDLGNSLVDEEPVLDLIRTRLPRTAQLAGAAVVLSLLFSIPVGLLAGMRQGSWLDSLGCALSVVGISMPNYWLGLLLILVFSVQLHWLPGFGRGDWRHMVLPVLTLATALTAYTARVLRSAVIEALQSEHLLALRARGVDSRLTLGRHVLRSCLIPVGTIVALEFGMVLEGAVITETIFAWPGIGDLLVTAVGNRDYPLIQGLVLLSATTFVVLNLLVDIGYCLLDPRVSLS